ncbi:unnamed protein product [Wuchereria bancrofti]|uniref:Uncharacterized protein n=1 Tax=Wuchereria bancrofti TaxID=6293 RepID=A0A3P7G6X2_WUCBA|nr:unnamed protein product [Wuchereria bancrofti]
MDALQGIEEESYHYYVAYGIGSLHHNEERSAMAGRSNQSMCGFPVDRYVLRNLSHTYSELRVGHTPTYLRETAADIDHPQLKFALTSNAFILCLFRSRNFVPSPSETHGFIAGDDEVPPTVEGAKLRLLIKVKNM